MFFLVIDRLNVYAIIQARLSSKRLPRKVLLKLGDKTILEILLLRLKKSQTLDGIILATTTNKQDDIISTIAKTYNVGLYRESEYNVLDRISNAAQKHGVDVIVRVTADNPLTDINILDKQVKILLQGNYDYVAPRGLILGLGSEVVSFKALEVAWKNAREPYQREHVTPYIYENPDIFNIYYFEPPKELKRRDIRLTIDEWEDYKLLLEIYRRLKDFVNVDTRAILELFNKEPSLAEINRKVKQRPYTHSEIAHGHP